MQEINRPGSLGRKPLAKGLAPSAIVALAAFALAAGCGRRGSGCGPSGASEMPPTPPASSLAGAPVIVRCFWGCIDLNRGKPVPPRELEHNCEERCVEICTKGCLTLTTDGGLGTHEDEERCEEGCEKQVKQR